MKKLPIVIACFVLLSVSATGAWASAVQITLSSSAQGGVVFTGTGGIPQVNFAFSGTCGIHANCISGNALLEPSATLGTYQMWMTGSPDTLTGGPSDYTVGGPNAVWLSLTFPGGTLKTQVTLIDVFGALARRQRLRATSQARPRRGLSLAFRAA